MSADCYLIGIGGSGSKCIDNYTYLCAAGLGPDSLSLGIVDQDQPNGNVGKVKRNISNYQNLYRKFRSEGQNNIILESNLFKTHIKTNVKDVHWTPIEDAADPNLKDLLEYPKLKDDLKHLMECLYHYKNDLELSLKEGFRGRPSIGTAAMISQMQENIPFWQNIFDALDATLEGREIRIFLISSIFGGTGAAGFPSIAKLLRSILREKGITDNVYIGGSLLLPYFTFPKPEDSQDIEEVAFAEGFLQQARGALDYYHRLFKNEKVFDELYIAGWDPLIPLNYFASGGQDQLNPPLLPELYSCLSASRFFTQDRARFQSEDSSSKIFYICRENENEFNWSDLPSINNNLNEVKDLLAQFTRTAVKFHYGWYKMLTSEWISNKGDNWYASLIASSSTDLNDTDVKDLIIKIDGYFESYLDWISSLINHSKSNVNDKINLIETNQFSTFNPEISKNGVKLTVGLSGSKNFNTLIFNSRSNESYVVLEELSDYKKTKDQTGIGVFMSALYKACRSIGGN